MEAKTPWGLGYSSIAITRLIHERKTAEAQAEIVQPLAAHGGDRKSEDVQHVQGANSTLKRGSGDADYLTARIARDRPDILERMKAGVN